MKKKTILLAVLLLVLATSCSKQEEPANVNETSEIQATTTPTTAISTPTLQTQVVNPNFSGCYEVKYRTSNEWLDIGGYNAEKTENSWLLTPSNIVVTKLGETRSSNILRVNKAKVEVSEGVLINIVPQAFSRSLGFPSSIFYSPDTDTFVSCEQVEDYSDCSFPSPSFLDVFVADRVEVRTYLDNNWCLKVLEETVSSTCMEITIEGLSESYNWGINKYGETICPSISIVEQ